MRNRKYAFDARREILAAGPLQTLRDLLTSAERFHTGKTAFREVSGQTATDYPYDRLVLDARALGTALLANGAEHRHAVLLGENCALWVVSFLAVTCTGVAVPLDKELPLHDLEQLTRSSEAGMIFTSPKYFETAKQLRAAVPSVEQIVLWGTPEQAGEDAVSVQTLIAQGLALLDAGDTRFADRTVRPDDLASIQFTSGTTGANKGVRITHRNICANINAIAQTVPVEPVSFSVLPLNHTLESDCHVLSALYFGVTVCFNNSLKRMMRNLQLFRPGMAVVVPLFIDEIYNGIWINARKNGREKQLKRALRLSRTLLFFGIDARDRLFGPVRESLGGELRLLVCGGAPINTRTARGLYDMGIDIINGYGITECSPLVTVNLKGRRLLESVGAPVPGVDIRIANANVAGVGEILVRGDNVTGGYYNDPDSNAVSFEDGWFCTGDYGCIDRRGRLWIAGRKKNLIILENGKNVFPEEIESAVLNGIDYIKEVVVYEAAFTAHGYKRRHIAATVRVKPESPVAALDEQARKQQICADLQRVNRQLAAYKRITAVHITEREFRKNAAQKVIRTNVVSKGNYEFI